MGFGPFLEDDKAVFSYLGLKEDVLAAGLALDKGKNFFDRVLDFNWHKQDKSPNWNVIDFPASEL
jgi:hypothetical protein